MTIKLFNKFQVIQNMNLKSVHNENYLTNHYCHFIFGD
jgi:hypothetical protein